MRGNISPFTIILIAASLSACLHGQQPLSDSQLPNGSESASKPYILTQTTREVGVDIVVTDASGQPVSGLTKQDFQVLEDHRPQRALSFESHSVGTSSHSVPRQLPQNTFTNLRSSTSGNASIAILLDSLDTPLNYQLYAYQQTVEFLKHLPTGIDVAIFTLNAKMELLQGFTSDTKLLLEAMRGRRAQPRPSFLLDSAPGAAVLREGSNDVYRKQVLLSGMAALGRYLAGFPGRKSLIWLTVDIPGHRNNGHAGPSQNSFTGADTPIHSADPVPTGGDLSSTITGGKLEGATTPSGQSATRESAQATGGTGASNQSANEAARASLSSPVTDAEDQNSDAAELGVSSLDDSLYAVGGALSLARVAIYVLDARGLMSPAELAINPEYQYQFAEMKETAEATGGHAFFNSNRLDLVMNQVSAESSNYYRLTYSPTNKEWKGAFRHLQVKLLPSTKNALIAATTGKPAVGPLRLSFRPGYYASESGTQTAGDHASFAKAVSAGPSAFTLARENKPNDSNALPQIPTPRESLQVSMTLGELPPTEIVFAASIKPMGGVLQSARKSPLPTGDFMREKYRNQSYRNFDILFATNIQSLALPIGLDGLHHGRVEFVSVVYNAQGDVVNSLITGLSLDLHDTSYNKMLLTGVGIHQSIAIPIRGEYIIRLGVHDTISDYIGGLEIPLSSVTTREEPSKPIEPKP